MDEPRSLGHREADPAPPAQGWLIAAILLLMVTALSTRVSVPWRLGITNDEAHHHLESWRNRYRTDNQNPMFLRKLDHMKQLRGERLELVKRLYHSGPLAQRATFVLIDPQPPLFPVLAEVIESLSHSNLIAQRMPSLLASLLTVWLMFCIGRRWQGIQTGLWMATLVAISSFAQYYAGIARPYALTQCGLAFVCLVFVAEQQSKPAHPWRLLLAALLAQSTQWMAWPVVGVFVGADLLRRWRSGARVTTLLKQTWWYCLTSLLLLGEMAIQLMNPVISEQARSPGLGALVEQIAVASPFGHLAELGTWGLWVAGGLFFGAMLVGVASLLRPRTSIERPRWAILIAFLAALIAPCLLGSSLRFMMIYSTMMLIVAGLGVARLLSQRGRAIKGAAAVLLVFLPLGLWTQKSVPDADWIFPPTRFADAAEDLAAGLQPGDTWIAYPYFNSNPLYSLAELPPPGMPLNPAALRQLLRERPLNRACFVFIHDTYRALAAAELATAEEIDNYGRIVLLRLPPQ